MIARVFPRKTEASPIDSLSFFGPPPMLFTPEFDEVHISVAFTWDMGYAEELAYQWDRFGVPVKMGGPAFGLPGGEFVPGRYLKPGYVITSRGCHNKCWFCSVWKREPAVKELPYGNGWNILDDNLLACSESHIRGVFKMLSMQKHRSEFTGGIEAKILKPWHVELFASLKPKPHQIFMAYDTPDDWEPLVLAAKIFHEAGFTRQHLRCYVLIGYKKDTMTKAEKRLMEVVNLGIFPMAMLWRDEKREIGKKPMDHIDDPAWCDFQREWARPAIIYSRIKEPERKEGE